MTGLKIAMTQFSQFWLLRQSSHRHQIPNFSFSLLLRSTRGFLNYLQLLHHGFLDNTNWLQKFLRWCEKLWFSSIVDYVLNDRVQHITNISCAMQQWRLDTSRCRNQSDHRDIVLTKSSINRSKRTRFKCLNTKS